MSVKSEGDGDVLLPLFETKAAKGGAAHKLFCSSMAIGIILVWLHRLVHVPGAGEPGRYAWLGMSFCEVMFGLYWIITQSARWQVVYRYPHKDRLSSRYGEKLPKVDIFVCTADPVLEPPSLVINTVLSVMSYNYPPEKLCVYVSDDGGSELTFYALLEASKFSEYWIPFCKKYDVEPRTPEAFFAQESHLEAQEWTNMKHLYEDMKSRIDSVVAKGCIPEEIKDQHKGFSEWSSTVTKQDHHSIVQILIDGRNTEAKDIEGNKLPTVVYLSREKRPGWPHNFKAGSMNSLIRVSSVISNAPFVLNLDCDMYSNDPDALKDALCFLLDETYGRQISYVQHPQRFNNITRNDIYANVAFATHHIELAGIDGFGGTLYCGTGCIHRRESLLGNKYNKSHRTQWNDLEDQTKGKTVDELEEASKILANSSYEKGSLWGKEMGLVYGCPVEDIVTGLTIQCRGWKPVYYNPRKNAFKGIAPTTLDVALIQFQRWSEGLFQIFFSKYCPFIYGHGKTKLGAQMGYCIYLLWAPFSLPVIYYVVVPAISLVHDVPLFPKVSSLWFAIFAYVFLARTIYSVVEDLACGNTLKGWLNWQRMWLFRRTTSYFFAFVDTVLKSLGLSQTNFVITGKVVDNEVQKRYQSEKIEFGSSSIMCMIISTLAMLNLFSLAWGVLRVLFSDPGTVDRLIPQMLLCGLLVIVNFPVYEALFFRSDRGSIPSSVLFKSVVAASIACLLPIY